MPMTPDEHYEAVANRDLRLSIVTTLITNAYPVEYRDVPTMLKTATMIEAYIRNDGAAPLEYVDQPVDLPPPSPDTPIVHQFDDEGRIVLPVEMAPKWTDHQTAAMIEALGAKSPLEINRIEAGAPAERPVEEPAPVAVAPAPEPVPSVAAIAGAAAEAPADVMVT